MVECKYLVHKRCYQGVYAPCSARILESGTPQTSDGETSLIRRFNIPHRLVDHVCLIPTSCNHCGLLLPFARSSLHCDECQAGYHHGCARFVPPLCGIDDQMGRELKARPLNQAAAAFVQTHPLPTAPSIPHLPMASLDSPSPRGRIGEYELKAVLGKGNFGKVMLACHRQTGQLVAIKAIRKQSIVEQDELEAVRTERRVFGQVTERNLPFLVHLHDCFQDSDRIYFVMEYVPGGDLMFHIQRRRFSLEEAKHYAAEVLVALESLHALGIIYRDLKLDNILLDLHGHIKLADYGLSKDRMPRDARTDTFCGTPEFIAPEILLKRPYSQSVDWWAFGILVYELLTGSAPFCGSCEDDTYHLITTARLSFPARFPADARDLITRLLVRTPELRLGCGRRGALEIQQHPFFAGIEWTSLATQPAPFSPRLDSPLDVKNFDPEFTQEEARLSPAPSTVAMLASPMAFDEEADL